MEQSVIHVQVGVPIPLVLLDSVRIWTKSDRFRIELPTCSYSWKKLCVTRKHALNFWRLILKANILVYSWLFCVVFIVIKPLYLCVYQITSCWWIEIQWHSNVIKNIIVTYYWIYVLFWWWSCGSIGSWHPLAVRHGRAWWHSVHAMLVLHASTTSLPCGSSSTSCLVLTAPAVLWWLTF